VEQSGDSGTGSNPIPGILGPHPSSGYVGGTLDRLKKILQYGWREYRQSPLTKPAPRRTAPIAMNDGGILQGTN
jgi:hypothetical protein